ncbi:MAG: GntR family transcriptional regulator [Verrucomicrobia bacterium]|nr:GntR family transcriptional regulator [Verrucomicrobiota bacterium]
MKLAPNPAFRSDSAASLLRAEILNGTSEPGALLAESAVAKRLGVSRVPVREALFALEREGLVEFSPTGRAFVKALTPQDFEELYILRLALEPLASRLAAPVLKADISKLEINLAATRRARSVQEVTLLDLEFHQLILEASGNARLVKLWRSLRGELELWLGRLHRSHQLQTRETLKETVDAHQSIVVSFRDQPSAVCERLMREHILGWREWLPLSS